MSLLEDAKKISVGKTRYGKEEIELAIAWARDEVGYSQVQKVTGKKNSNAYLFLAIALKEAIQQNSL